MRSDISKFRTEKEKQRHKYNRGNLLYQLNSAIRAEDISMVLYSGVMSHGVSHGECGRIGIGDRFWSSRSRMVFKYISFDPNKSDGSPREELACDESDVR